MRDDGWDEWRRGSRNAKEQKQEVVYGRTVGKEREEPREKVRDGENVRKDLFERSRVSA